MPTNTWDTVKKVIFLGILAFLLLTILTWTNIIKCNQLGNGWCNVYWGLMGPPKILIAHGYDGLGNAQKLQDVFANRDILGVRTTLKDLKFLAPGTLAKYDLVIVTQAKTMTAEEVAMFYDYAQNGGKLIWTGDAGTGITNNEQTPQTMYDLEYKNITIDNAITPEEEQILRNLANNVGVNIDDKTLTVTAGTINTPWTRITKDGKVLKFGNEILSAEYRDNYCLKANCTTATRDYIGNLNHNEDSPISFKLSPSLPLNGDFSLVDVVYNTTTKIDLMLDTRAVIISKNGQTDYGKTNYPIIIISGLGEKVIYSGVPLENFVDLETPIIYQQINTGMFYPTIIEQIYENMIRGQRT